MNNTYWFIMVHNGFVCSEKPLYDNHDMVPSSFTIKINNFQKIPKEFSNTFKKIIKHLILYNGF